MKIIANGAFDRASVISTLVRHEIVGLTETSAADATHRRIVTIEGKPVELGLCFEPDGVLVSVGGREADPGETGTDPGSIARLVRNWFDLDADISTVDRQLSGQGCFEAQVTARPGIRITRYPSRWEAIVLIVLGQQVSLSAGRTFGTRLVAAYGEREGSGLLRFPSPDRVATEPVERLRETLGLTSARARTIHGVARLFAEGSSFDPVRLAGLPGVGPWTLACFSIRGAAEADGFPAGDAVLRRALGGVSAREAEQLARRWKPYRSYAAVRLWAEAVANA